MDVWVQTHQRLRWLRGLLARLHGLGAGALWSAVGLLVLRQLCLLLAMFLPFQVMFMLATRQVSRYLGWVPPSVPFESLVVALVLAVLALYGLQLLCTRWAHARLAVAASRLLAHANKLAMFKDDRQHARDVVQRLAAWCVAGLLWLVYAALGLWVDAPVFAAVLALVAIYALFNKIGDYVPWLGLNTHGGLILAYMGGIALHVWTIKGYFDSIDGALDRAAAMDGASPFQTFRHIFLPLSTPILAVVFVLSFIAIIGDYPLASVLLRQEDNLTLAVGARKYLFEHNYMWGDFAAAAILSGAPITALFLVAQRYLVSGLSAGGVKG